MYLFKSLHLLIQRYLPEDHITLIQKAYLVARNAHDGQTRSSGEPYITHPIEVACILANMRLDYKTLIAALLHDVIEDTPATYQDMEQLFGKSVAALIEGVSKLDKIKFRDKKEAQAENFRKMVMAMVQDIRVVLIKLADRTHNMRTLSTLRPDKRRRIARETLEIYSPLAHRLGIHHLKIELEELGFKALYPHRYRVIKEVVKVARGNRKEMIQKILAEIKGRLIEAGISGRVSGREKHPYSIYYRMHLKEQRFCSIMDIYAFQVIVSEVDTCYRVLGQMHSLYKPRPGRVKDYIAIPKANGYQSLHTSMIGPHGVPVEVQIRTEDMDQMAEMGVAAHWAYKTPGKTGTTAQIRAQRWMQSLLELQKSSASSFDFIESVKSDLFPDEIYVFTPKGRIIELPAGATAVDFAYAVHTDIGHACVGARVDRQPYQIFQPLSSGQTVEIITDSGTSPDANWLNFVVSSKARAKIRQMLTNLKSSIGRKRDLLHYTLNSNSKPTELQREKIQRKLNRLSVVKFNNLLNKIYFGQAMSLFMANNVQLNLVKIDGPYILPITGVDRLLITFAKCYYFTSGYSISTSVRATKKLVLHHKYNPNILDAKKETEILMLMKMTSNQELFAKIKVDMLKCMSRIASSTTFNDANSSFSDFIKLTTRNRIHLAHMMRIIAIISDIIQVNRKRN